MGRKFTKQTGKFTAQTADGQEHRVFEFTHYIEVSSRAGTQRVESGKSLKLKDGTPVNRHDKGKYQMVRLVEHELFSDDPLAP